MMQQLSISGKNDSRVSSVFWWLASVLLKGHDRGSLNIKQSRSGR
jgi:hypothetical protein